MTRYYKKSLNEITSRSKRRLILEEVRDDYRKVGLGLDKIQAESMSLFPIYKYARFKLSDNPDPAVMKELIKFAS